MDGRGRAERPGQRGHRHPGDITPIIAHRGQLPQDEAYLVERTEDKAHWNSMGRRYTLAS